MCHFSTFKIKALGGLIKPTTNIMKTIRAKFNMAEITKFGNAGGTKVTLLQVVRIFPTVGESEENEAIGIIPSGKIEMHFANLGDDFEFGEYYVDFTKVE